LKAATFASIPLPTQVISILYRFTASTFWTSLHKELLA